MLNSREYCIAKWKNTKSISTNWRFRHRNNQRFPLPPPNDSSRQWAAHARPSSRSQIPVSSQPHCNNISLLDLLPYGLQTNICVKKHYCRVGLLLSKIPIPTVNRMKNCNIIAQPWKNTSMFFGDMVYCKTFQYYLTKACLSRTRDHTN